ILLRRQRRGRVHARSLLGRIDQRDGFSRIDPLDEGARREEIAVVDEPAFRLRSVAEAPPPAATRTETGPIGAKPEGMCSVVCVDCRAALLWVDSDVPTLPGRQAMEGVIGDERRNF